MDRSRALDVFSLLFACMRARLVAVAIHIGNHSLR